MVYGIANSMDTGVVPTKRIYCSTCSAMAISLRPFIFTADRFHPRAGACSVRAPRTPRTNLTNKVPTLLNSNQHPLKRRLREKDQSSDYPSARNSAKVLSTHVIMFLKKKQALSLWRVLKATIDPSQ